MWQRNLQFFINTYTNTHIQHQIPLKSAAHAHIHAYKPKQTNGRMAKLIISFFELRLPGALSLLLSLSLPLYFLCFSLSLRVYLISWQIYGKNKTADDVWKTMIGCRCRESLLALLPLFRSATCTNPFLTSPHMWVERTVTKNNLCAKKKCKTESQFAELSL